MAKLSMKGLLGIAVGLSLLTSLLVYQYLHSAATAPPKEGSVVVVAKVDIPPKTQITAEMVQEVKVPAEYMQPGAIQVLKSIIGVITREQIIAGEQIVERRLVIEGKAIGFTGRIPRDKRAVSVAVTEVTGVAGFVKPGDYVDVIVTFDTSAAGDNVSNLVLQNILVLAVNREAADGVAPSGGMEAGKDSAKEAVKSTTVTLAVTPDDASRLILSEEKGKIRLALRPYLPLTGLSINNPVTPQDLVGMHTSPVKNAPANSSPPAPVRYAEPPVSYREQAPSIADSRPPVADTKGIQMIKGTKIEIVSMN